ncbi:mitotic spindle assembly checkpoint protein mad2 [Holotrichia oblita]|uniref:Mitotic spindle assembly checkpoint protein mad2 n=1 Tax=Holotrichia oblita TaxID=644536 RepID=A0ACB9TEX5_HOLOL|nr:mitotic spindle assembly checkpoint protein mad2 [Holotrichia oblita]
MTAVEQKNKSAITLKGSSDIICEYLDYGINSILYQRGLYPPETFKTAENYGLTILMSQDNKIQEFLSTTLNQLKEVMERWDFNVQYEGNIHQGNDQVSDKPLKQIRNEIRDVMKQIASSVAYLPLLDCLCSFDIQIYTKSDVVLPNEWADAEPANVKNAQSVKMRSFSTNIHKMETVVTYKNDD